MPSCDPNDLMLEARCFDKCIPPGSQREIAIMLLCRWAQVAKTQVNPPVSQFSYEPPTAQIDWNDSGGNHIGDLASFNATADKATVSSVSLDNSLITNVSNINDLPALQTLDVGANPGLASLDLTGCTSLLHLSASQGAITTLDLTPCLNLIDADLGGGSLTSLILSGLVNMNGLVCSHNSLTSLDCTGLVNLATLDCNSNAITPTIVGLGTCTAMATIDCSVNALTSIDLHTLTALTRLDAGYNSISSANVLGCVVLSELYFDNNKLENSTTGSGNNSVNIVLSDMATNGNSLTPQTVVVRNELPSPPDAGPPNGIVAVAALTALGFSILTD